MKKIFIAVIILLVLGLGYWVLFKKPFKQLGQNKTQDSATSSVSAEKLKAPKFDYTEPTKAPEGFPPSIPIEKDAKITDNFIAVSPEGKTTVVREFASKVTMAQNYELYKAYLKNSGYTIETDLSQADQKIVSGTKDGYRLRVRAYKVDAEVRVTLNYVQM